jgi:pimeloyl-ACP methyl ester carboxylesterase
MKWVSVMLLGLAMISAASVSASSGTSEGEFELMSENATIQMVHVNDIEMAYKVFGEGEPLVLIMGYGSAMDLWPPRFLDLLSRSYKVIVFDNRGMGYSTAPPGNFSIEEMADDAAGLLDALEIEQAHVLGWSMGSLVAQEVAFRHPERVDKLVLYASNCGGAEAVQPSPEVLEELTNTSGTPEEVGMRLFGLLFPPEFLKENPEFYKEFPMPTEPSHPENMGRQAGAIAAWNGSCDRLYQIECPVLLIAGTEDVITPPDNSLIMAERIPGSWLVRFEGAGHGLMYQYPERLASIVSAFLEP